MRRSSSRRATPARCAGTLDLLAASPGLRAEFGARAACRARAFAVQAQAAGIRAAWREAAERAGTSARIGVA